MKLSVRKVGNSLGVILPKEIASQLQLEEGDSLTAILNEEGLMLSPYDPDFEEMMSVYFEVSGKYKNALKELARERTKVDK